MSRFINLQSIATLAECKNLRRLSLSEANSSLDLLPLRGCKKLNFLDLSFCWTDITPLYDCDNLKTLIIDDFATCDPTKFKGHVTIQKESYLYAIIMMYSSITAQNVNLCATPNVLIIIIPYIDFSNLSNFSSYIKLTHPYNLLLTKHKLTSLDVRNELNIYIDTTSIYNLNPLDLEQLISIVFEHT